MRTSRKIADATSASLHNDFRLNIRLEPNTGGRLFQSSRGPLRPDTVRSPADKVTITHWIGHDDVLPHGSSCPCACRATGDIEDERRTLSLDPTVKGELQSSIDAGSIKRLIVDVSGTTAQMQSFVRPSDCALCRATEGADTLLIKRMGTQQAPFAEVFLYREPNPTGTVASDTPPPPNLFAGTLGVPHDSLAFSGVLSPTTSRALDTLVDAYSHQGLNGRCTWVTSHDDPDVSEEDNAARHRAEATLFTQAFAAWLTIRQPLGAGGGMTIEEMLAHVEANTTCISLTDWWGSLGGRIRKAHGAERMEMSNPGEPVRVDGEPLSGSTGA